MCDLDQIKAAIREARQFWAEVEYNQPPGMRLSVQQKEAFKAKVRKDHALHVKQFKGHVLPKLRNVR